MGWQDVWEPLQARLESWLASADCFLVQHASFDNANWDQIIEATLLPEAKEIVAGFEALASMADLPTQERLSLKGMLDSLRTRFQAQRDRNGVKVFAVFLRTLCAPLEHASASAETRRRSIVERAFEHLNRSLVIDLTLRRRWQVAFQRREEACEKLGSVHLLMHGAFAFKVDATGARTDLVFGEPVSTQTATRSSEVLVLTEWKVVRDPNTVMAQAQVARNQAKLYASGPLRELELSSYRFIVLVSNVELSCPRDSIDNNVCYRHICVNVKPRSPSRAAASMARGRRSARDRAD